MAIEFNAFGCTEVKFDSASAGFSEDGVSVQVRPFFHDLASDCYGGRAGPPADSQLLGGLALITADLHQYEKAQVHKYISFDPANHAAMDSGIGNVNFPAIGRFIKQGASPIDN